MNAARVIRVDSLARIEGEAALDLTIDGGRVSTARLRVFEPPRFFEALLRGRAATEAPDLTSRICGICPAAYQLAAAAAVEDALGVEIDEPLQRLRRLLMCGEWIQSHALHVFVLHAPDFLGCQDAVEMSAAFPHILARGLRLKKLGDDLVAAIGGRSIHPVNVRVGGFYRVPAPAALRSLLEELRWARDAAYESVAWAATLPCPDFARKYTFLALRASGAYPMEGGHVVSSGGLDTDARGFEAHIAETQVPDSTALHSHLDDGAEYLTGPLARYNLNAAALTPLARQAAREAGLGPTGTNPFKSLIVRAVEILHACDEAIRLILDYGPPGRPAVDVSNRPGVGCAVVEAPRGVLFHRYELDAAGTIVGARIVPPTSQNLATIEHDLTALVEGHLGESDDELTGRCEHAIRNHDPCISCSAHFLRVHVNRASR